MWITNSRNPATKRMTRMSLKRVVWYVVDLVYDATFVRGRPELSSFSRAYIAYAGRNGVRGRRTLLKNRLWCIAILRRGLEINIFKVLFW